MFYISNRQKVVNYWYKIWNSSRWLQIHELFRLFRVFNLYILWINLSACVPRFLPLNLVKICGNTTIEVNRTLLIDAAGGSRTSIACLLSMSKAVSLAACWWRAIRRVTLTETPLRVRCSKLQLRLTTVDLWKWQSRLGARISSPSGRYARIRRSRIRMNEDESVCLPS